MLTVNISRYAPLIILSVFLQLFCSEHIYVWTLKSNATQEFVQQMIGWHEDGFLVLVISREKTYGTVILNT